MKLRGRAQMHRLIKRTALVLAMTFALTITASADWYSGGTVYRSPNYWFYVDHERYAGEMYSTSWEDMAERTALARATGVEYPPPSVFYLETTSVFDAESQIESALRYVPYSIAVAFPDRKTTDIFCEKYADWRENGNRIDLFIGAVWTRTDGLYSIGRCGNSVVITIDRYADGWLAYADTSDVIRVYADEAYSQRLKQFRTDYIDSVEGTETEKVVALCNKVCNYATYDYAEYERMRNNGDIVVDVMAHSVRGVVERRRAVCDGFTFALQFAAACHGIKAFDVIAQNDSGNHAYSKVRIDGKWVNVDVTQMELHWSDPERYMGFSDDEFAGYSRLAWVERIYGSD